MIKMDLKALREAGYEIKTTRNSVVITHDENPNEATGYELIAKGIASFNIHGMEAELIMYKITREIETELTKKYFK